ncbi:hypothetical protein FJ875_25720 [Salmonella enterica]|nr:hypothetical protein [Salmonella enterica]
MLTSLFLLVFDCAPNATLFTTSSPIVARYPIAVLAEPELVFACAPIATPYSSPFIASLPIATPLY